MSLRSAKYFLAILLGACVFGAEVSLYADQPRITSLERQVSSAAAIVQAKVRRLGSRFEDGRIYSYYSVNPLETLKGGGNVQGLRVPGGEVGVVAYIVPGAPDFVDNGELVLFLRGDSGPVYELDGISSGFFEVEQDEYGLSRVRVRQGLDSPLLSAEGKIIASGSSLPLRDFKALIYGYQGREAPAAPQYDQLGKSKTKAAYATGSFADLPELAAGNVQAGYSRIFGRPVDIFWDIDRDYGPVRNGAVRWYFNPDSIAGISPYGVTPEQARSAAEYAFDQWSEVPGARINFQLAGTRNDIRDNKLDLINVITFADSEYINGIQKDAIASARPFALTRRIFVGPEGLDYDLDGKVDFPDFPGGIWEAGTIIDCDIRWDVGGQFADVDFAVNGEAGALSMQGVFLHETGHFAGLVHSPIRDMANIRLGTNRTPTMYSVALSNPSNDIENPMISLETDDMISLGMLYPTSGFSSDYGKISGRITKGTDGTPGRGIFVVAFSESTGEPYRSVIDGYNRADFASGVFSDQQGKFTIHGLPAGGYVIAIQPMDDIPVGTNRNSFNTLVSRFGDVDYIWDEFYNGAAESDREDDPLAFESVRVTAGSEVKEINIFTNVYPTGRHRLRRMFGEADFIVSVNQLRDDPLAFSSSEELAARRLPAVFEPPYRLVSVSVDFSSVTAPPDGALVTWPEIIVALSDPADSARPDLENPLAVITDFEGDGTLISSDPLPFDYPIEVTGEGDVWIVVRSPERRFNAFHNADYIGAGQGELNVDESFVSLDGGETFRSILERNISWRMGMVAEGESETVPLAQPVLVKSEAVGDGGQKLYFSAVRGLDGRPPDEPVTISLRQNYVADSYPVASAVNRVRFDAATGEVSFLTSIYNQDTGDSTRFRVRNIISTGTEIGDMLSATLIVLEGEGPGGALNLTRVSGADVHELTGLWQGSLEGTAGEFVVNLALRGTVIKGSFIWPQEQAQTSNSDLQPVYSSEPGDTVVVISMPQEGIAGYELHAETESGRRSITTTLGLGSDKREPNERIKTAKLLLPMFGYPSRPHSLSAVRGAIAASDAQDDIDYFKFEVQRGDSIVVDLDASSNRPFKPISSLDGFLEAFDSTGTRFRDINGVEQVNDDDSGLDPFLSFVSPRDITVYLRLVDALVGYGDRGSVRGLNQFYELRVQNFPRKGDVIRNNVLDINDVLAAMEMASSGGGKDEPAKLFSADINNDGEVEFSDVAAVFRLVLNDPLRNAGLASAGVSVGSINPHLKQRIDSGNNYRLVYSLAFNQAPESDLYLAAQFEIKNTDSKNIFLSNMLSKDYSDINYNKISSGDNVVIQFAITVGKECFVAESVLDLFAFDFAERPVSLDDITVIWSGIGSVSGGDFIDGIVYEQAGGSLNFSLPKAFSLAGNYPNPFNPTTTISFQVPESVNGAQSVRIAVFDIRGRLLRELVNGEYSPGNYSVVWDGRDRNGNTLASGVYFYCMEAAGFDKIRKMILLK